MTKQVWVSPDPDGGWRIHNAGSKRDSGHKDTKNQAIERAREIAINKGAELKVQNKDGTIGISNSYGNDPCPPLDK